MKSVAKTLVLAFVSGFLLVWAGNLLAAETPVNVAGNWELSREGRNGPTTEALTIAQDGSKITGTLKGQRGESKFEGSVTGNKISFTVKLETDNGTFTMEYSATVDGDSMKGILHTERFDRDFTAKRIK
jgi:hypothetical protein